MQSPYIAQEKPKRLKNHFSQIILSQMFRTSCFLIFLALSLSLSVFSCANKDTSSQSASYIAKVGTGFEVNFETLHNNTRLWFLDRRFEDPIEAHMFALQLMTDNQLKRLDFFERGFHRDLNIIEPIRRIVHEEMMIEYFLDEFLGKYTTEENILEAYQNIGREVTFRQIVIFKRDMDGNRFENAGPRSKEVFRMLQDGRSFNLLLSEYSEHQPSAQVGGFVNPIDWQTRHNSPVNWEAFQMEKGDQKLIETATAFHIVEVTDIRQDTQRPPLEEVRNDILRRLESVYVEFSQQEYDDFRDSIINKSTMQWNTSALNTLLEWSKAPRFFAEAYIQKFSDEISHGNNFTILTYNDGQTVTLEDYLYLNQYILVLTPASSYTREDLEKHILEALINNHIVELAREKNIDKRILDPYTKNQSLRNQFLILYNQHVIQSQVPEPSAENLSRFYEEVKDSLFYQLQTAYTSIIIVNDEAHARELIERHNAGTPFDNLAHEKHIRNFSIERDGTIRTRHRVQQPHLAQVVFSKQTGEVFGPILFVGPQQDERLAIVKIVNRLEERYLEIDEVQKRLEEHFNEYYYNRIEAELVAELRKKWPVIVNKDLLITRLQEMELL